MRNIFKKWLKLLIFNCFLCVTFGQENNIVFNYNNTYKYNLLYTVNVSKYTEYIMEFAGDLDYEDTPARVTVASEYASRTYPLFVTARQQKGVFSWQLPMIVQTPSNTEEFTNISRTLCPRDNIFDENYDTCETSPQNTPIIHLTSSSPENITVDILVEKVENFYIKLNSTTNVTCTPSQPKYFFYPFKQRPDTALDLETQSLMRKSICKKSLDESDKKKIENYLLRSNVDSTVSFSWSVRKKSVILMIESDNDVCAVVSIQNFSCPVFDNERDILYDGHYLTMTRRGGITLTQDMFPLGFYIVFIVKSSDEDCLEPRNYNASLPPMAHYFGWQKHNINFTSDGRLKSFSFRIIETISYQEYAIGAGVMLAFFLFFYIAFIIAIIYQRGQNHCSRNTGCLIVDQEGLVSAISGVNSSSTFRRRHRRIPEQTAGSTGEGDTTTVGCSSSSDTDSNFSAHDGRDTRLDGKLCVAHLARCRPRVLSARSRLYLWNVLTVAIFYTLPVIQLVITYQRLLNQSGNQDLCYFNFLCAHPLLSLSDFNHVYSNLGYVLLGILFLCQVWRRHKHHKAKSNAEKELGIPQHFGLVYAMGIALVSEGLLSAAYHVCPNSMNFQFDTSFMYVTSVLCMVKIYQSRHPDINARAHATFGVLALIIFIGLVGVLNANFYFWIGFTVLHLITCLVLTFQIYYLGRFKLKGVVCRATRELVSRPLAAITPTHCGRCVLLVIANVCNWTIAAYGVMNHSRDFASHLLVILMSNLFLYTLFYIVMKLLHRESIAWYSWVFIALTYTVWFSSSYFYLDQSTNWAMTPAQSRQSNRVCSLLQLYDSHDIWHFMSSTAMFFSFNMYLTIDDKLARVPRTQIMVF